LAAAGLLRSFALGAMVLAGPALAALAVHSDAAVFQADVTACAVCHAMQGQGAQTSISGAGHHPKLAGQHAEAQR
jgi:cytochrome c553